MPEQMVDPFDCLGERADDDFLRTGAAAPAAKDDAHDHCKQNDSDHIVGEEGKTRDARRRAKQTARRKGYAIRTRGLGIRQQVQKFLNVPVPCMPGLPGIHEQKADHHGDRDVHQTNDKQPGSLMQGNVGSQERVEDRKENERDRQHLEHRDDKHAELA